MLAGFSLGLNSRQVSIMRSKFLIRIYNVSYIFGKTLGYRSVVSKCPFEFSGSVLLARDLSFAKICFS